jgi:AcrR family transcriptional regulator
MNMSTEGATTLGGAAGNTARGPDRRARRRQETIAEILGIATEVMTEQGVNGLSLAEVARRLGVQPPSLYKYFPSLMAVYDALFRRGQAIANEPGLPWGQGRFTPLFPKLMRLLAAAYPAAPARRSPQRAT